MRYTGPAHFDLNEPAAMRALLASLLARAELAGLNRKGEPVLQIRASVAPWLLEQLLVFDAENEDTEDGDPAEEDGPPER